MRIKQRTAELLFNRSSALALLMAAGSGVATATHAQGAPVPPANAEPALADILGDSATNATTDAPAAATDAPAPTTDAPAPAANAPIPVPVPVETTTNPSSPPKRAATTQLEEIIVTATKREKSLRSIPESISSISGNELEQRDAQGADDIAKLVPGVNVNNEDSQPSRITVNGISSQPYTGFTVGVLFGDVSFTDEYIPLVALDPQPFDLKSVDVLKGPQGTLFGASALNGAVRYVPNDAHFERWEFKYYGEYSNFSGSMFKPAYGGVVNVPIGDSLAFRVTGFERETPGYMSPTSLGLKDTNGVNQGGVRGMLHWAPTDPLDVKLTYAWQNTHVGDDSATNNANGELTDTSRKQLSPTATAYTLADLNAAYDFDWAKLVSDSAIVRKQTHSFTDASYTLPTDLPIIAITQQGTSNTLSQELRLVSSNNPQSPWQWVSGLYFSQQKISDLVEIPIGNKAIPIATLEPIIEEVLPFLSPLFSSNNEIEGVRTFTNVTIREEALFGDVTRRFWDDVELTLGGRLYQIDSGGLNDLSGAVITAVKLSPEVADAADVREKGFNPHASLLWHATPDIIGYVSAAKGFRAGGVQSGAPVLPTDHVPAVFNSDTIWDYEGGIRTQWFDKTVHFDVSGFYERWKNPQYNQANSSGLLSYITNVGGVKSLGGNVALQWLLPIKGLLLNATGGYVRAVTTKPYEFSGSTVGVGAPFPYAPHWQTATTLAYTFDIGELGVQSQLTHTYLSKAVNDLVQQLPILGYQELDASLGISDQRLKWLPDISFTVKNMTDSRAYSQRKPIAANPVIGTEYEYITPRAIFVRVSGHF
jgi:iron complex outermembrane receptor protein